MKKVVKIYPVILICILSVLSFTTVFGQDLGSSNGLFRASNPKSKNTSTEKKTTPKSNPVKKTAKKIVPRRNSRDTAKKTNTTNKNQTQIAKKPVRKNNLRNNDVIIVVGKRASGDVSQLYEEAIDEGNIARDARDYSIAETAYRRAKKLNSKDSRAVYGLGNIYSDQQRWEESEQLYRDAIALEPDNPDSYIALSFVLTQPILGKELSSRFIEAEKSARKAIELDSQNPYAYDQLGVALELNGKIGSETRDAFLKAISIEPEFALAYAHLGRLMRRNGKVTESTNAYSKAIIFSRDVPTMILVADVLQSQQRYNDSEQLLRRALREDPKNPSALFLLGRALTIGGQYDEAETVLKKSVEVSPNSFVSYVLLGSVYTRRGDFAVAEKTLNNALKVISENERKNLAQAYETVGDGYLKNGKKTDAMRAYRQAVALDSQKDSLTQKLARVQL
ncbi:MAG: tetratricopeptide repeat protein [Pyrinomonadaceae bacterium]